jgi:hypothetical protein
LYLDSAYDDSDRCSVLVLIGVFEFLLDLVYEQQKMANPSTAILSNWTPQQMDAYLAIPEVALEWNVVPG